MPRVWLKIKLPRDSLGEFSTNHPDDEFRMLTSHRTEEGLRVITEADTSDVEGFIQIFEEAPEVRSYEVLRTDQQEVLLQFEASEHASRVAARVG
jgi:hypothetical protein